MKKRGSKKKNHLLKTEKSFKISPDELFNDECRTKRFSNEPINVGASSPFIASVAGIAGIAGIAGKQVNINPSNVGVPLNFGSSVVGTVPDGLFSNILRYEPDESLTIEMPLINNLVTKIPTEGFLTSKTVTKDKSYHIIYNKFKGIMNQDRVEYYSIKTVKFLSYLMLKKQREECFGDVMEARSELKRDGESRLFIEGITLGRIILLFIHLILTPITDIIHARKTTN